MWNRREISDEPGLGQILLKPDPIFVKAKDGHFEQIEITAKFQVSQRLYFGELPITKITGFQDETTGHIILPGNTEIVFDVIDVGDVERNWLRIPSVDVLAVKPFMTLTAFDYYPSTTPGNSDFPKISGT